MAAEQRTKLRLDEFISKALSDPKDAGEVLLITGFIGASPEEEHARVYLDPSLSTCFDIKTSDITYSEPLSKEESPIGGSRLWVKRAAQVYFGAGGQSTKGKFFEGPVSSAYGSQFGAGGATGAYGPIGPTGLYCQPSQFCPPSVNLPCVTPYCTLSILECQQLTIRCITPACPVQSRICPVSLQQCFTPACPVQSVACVSPVCPVNTILCVASPNCPPVGPGTTVQGQGGVEAAFVASQFCTVPTVKACTHQANCYSQGCFPTYELNCDYAAKARAANYVFGVGTTTIDISYRAGCWFSYDACPTVYGICGGPGGGQSRVFCPTV